jgi:hypothetical protein
MLPAPPDAQAPDPATAQTPALPFGWHWPATHELLAGHCASLLHVAPAHTAPEQPPAPHASCTIAGHVPEPLHIAGSVITPAEHDPARHSTAEPGYPHCVALLPSHVPPHALPSEAQACRDPWGPPATLVQVPTWPATSQAWHCPPQAALQQTPSTHWPLAHWVAPAHALPFARSGPQIPAEQKLPETQSKSEAQLPAQACGPHT